MLLWAGLLFHLIFSWSAFAKDLRPVDLCPGWVLSAPIDPGLSDVEHRLVCGGEGAWKDIPANQGSYSLKNFLQDRGYLHPRFHQVGDTVVVDIGEPTRVTEVRAVGAPPKFKIWRRRKIVGAILTPKILDEMENWTKRRLESYGYGCPEVHAEGDPDTGVVTVVVNPGVPQDLIAIEERTIPGVAPGIMRRYDAFELGERFNGDLLSLSESRVGADRVVESLHFTTRCEKEGIVATQTAVAGPPRLLTVGAGVDTEGVIVGRISWKNTRLGNYASSYQLSLLASVIEQQFQASANWYLLRRPSRFFLQPTFTINHQNELYYEVATQRLQSWGITSWDSNELGLKFFLGPSYEVIQTLNGTGPGYSHFLSLTARVSVMSHGYEFYATSPRNGFLVSLQGDFSGKGIFADASAQRIGLAGEALWNIGGYDPPLWIVGLRGGAASVFTPSRPGPSNQLPPTFLQFLGGSSNLRGYGRQELPGPYGALTSAFLGTELRLSHTFPLWMEPFLFYDIGALGSEPAAFDSVVFTSPGIGIRVESPIGVFRTTFAHGYPLNPPAGTIPGHFQFFFSYGEEF